MNKQPFFSIIVPIYQDKSFLKDLAVSLIKQNFKSFEIIMVDDGSTDGSAEICDDLAKENKNVTVFHKKNGGVSSARNYGLKFCKGQWIIFVDSDDIVSTSMCKILFNYIEKNPLLDFVACNYTRDPLKFTSEYNLNDIVLKLHDQDQNFDLIKQMLLSKYDESSKKFRETFGNNIILNSPCAKAYKKNFLKENNILFDERIEYSEDMLFNIEVLSHKAKGIFVDKVIYCYRENKNSVTNKSYTPNVIKNYIEFKKKVKEIPDYSKYRYLEKSINAYTFKSGLMIISSDIFQPSNSFFESRNRFFEITNSREFTKLYSWKILKSLRKYLDLKTRVKGSLLLEKNFFALFILYRVIKVLLKK